MQLATHLVFKNLISREQFLLAISIIPSPWAIIIHSVWKTRVSPARGKCFLPNGGGVGGCGSGKVFVFYPAARSERKWRFSRTSLSRNIQMMYFASAVAVAERDKFIVGCWTHTLHFLPGELHRLYLTVAREDFIHFLSLRSESTPPHPRQRI